jgi:hypothetical protein
MMITSNGLHIYEQQLHRDYPTRILTLNRAAFVFPDMVAEEIAEVLNKHYYGNKNV